MVPVIENVPWWSLVSVHDPVQSKVKYAYCGYPELPDPPPLPPPLPPLLLPLVLPPAAAGFAGRTPEQPATAQKITTKTIPRIAQFPEKDIPHPPLAPIRVRQLCSCGSYKNDDLLSGNRRCLKRQ
jgi:hypothetical protein